MRSRPRVRIALGILAWGLSADRVAAVPPPPSLTQAERWSGCQRRFAPDQFRLKVKLGPPPQAPAELNPQWSATILPTKDVGRVVSLSWLSSAQAPSPRGPLLLAVTDRSFWLLIPLEKGIYDPAQPAIAFPMQNVTGPPAHAVYSGMNILVDIPNKSELLSYDGYYCAGSSAPIASLDYHSFGEIERMDLAGNAAQITLTGPDNRRFRLNYSAPEESLPAFSAEAADYSHEAGVAPGALLTDFPIAHGCDRLEIDRNPGDISSTIKTFCSKGFARREETAEQSSSKRHRSPPPVTKRRTLGLVQATVVAVAYGSPQWEPGRLFQTVPIGDRRDPGVPDWLYMIAQPRGGGPISLLAFKPYRAHFPRAPGGIDPPPPAD